MNFPLKPDRAAPAVRRGDFDTAARLGFRSPAGTVEIDNERQGGWSTVRLNFAQEVALLPAVRPLVD